MREFEVECLDVFGWLFSFLLFLKMNLVYIIYCFLDVEMYIRIYIGYKC